MIRGKIIFDTRGHPLALGEVKIRHTDSFAQLNLSMGNGADSASRQAKSRQYGIL